jgi:hypothetical protein
MVVMGEGSVREDQVLVAVFAGVTRVIVERVTLKGAVDEPLDDFAIVV